MEKLSDFVFNVPRIPAKYTIEATYPGFEPGYATIEISKIGKREQTRTIPDIVMRREPKKVGEVTVTASKIKFYNRGDTLVYNADAFMLARGSMLDALISQLPGWN